MARSSVRSFRREVFQAASASIGFVLISLDGFCRFGGRPADRAGLTQHQVLRIGHHSRQIAVDRTTIIARRAAVQVRFLRVAPIRTAWHAGHRAADDDANRSAGDAARSRSEEHTSELQSLMRSSYAVLCLKKNTYHTSKTT